MIIVSITPRIDYHQGNKWDMKLDNMAELHRPTMDGIGFQDLLTDEMAAWETKVASNGSETFNSIGKQPAWIHYQTDVNELYGGFAEELMYMANARRFEYDQNGNTIDLTSYIDPSKYNYIFDEQRLEAQNFWIQLGLDIEARLLMSANIMPWL